MISACTVGCYKKAWLRRILNEVKLLYTLLHQYLYDFDLCFVL